MMAGLLDFDPLTLGLLSAGSTLMQGRARGGGIGAAPMAFAQGAMTGQDRQRQQKKDQLAELMTMLQMQEMQRKASMPPELFGKLNPSDFTPESLATFQKSQNYGDLVRASQPGGRPAPLQEWDEFIKMDPQTRAQYLQMKRQGYSVGDVGGVPTMRPMIPGLPPIPLSNINTEAQAQGTLAEGKQVGEARGAQRAKSEVAKPAQAQSVLDLVAEAEPLLNQATGSLGGAAVDAAAGAFGVSTEGAKANAQLKIIEAGLMMGMPRMEGPQSNLDVQLYRQAAASIGNEMVPAEQRKAALALIKRLNQKYAPNSAPKPQGGPAVGTRAKTKDGRSVEWDGKGWKLVQ